MQSPNQQFQDKVFQHFRSVEQPSQIIADVQRWKEEMEKGMTPEKYYFMGKVEEAWRKKGKK